VTTASINTIWSTSAKPGGTVVYGNGSPVNARGICWSTSPNPTTANNTTSNGTGEGSFISSMTGLTYQTTYYVRAYAINDAGTGYGEELSFTTAYGIGEIHEGGYIFYLDGSGEHGLVAALTNLPLAKWGCWGTLVGGTSNNVGTGQANTTLIVNNTCHIGDGITGAAEACDSYDDGTYDDWFLPSRNELDLMWKNLHRYGCSNTAPDSSPCPTALGGFYEGNFNDYTYYWSSTEYSKFFAWIQYFFNGNQSRVSKNNNFRLVQAVRAF
jgi:hypothetical protein